MLEMPEAARTRVARINGRADAFNDTMLDLLEHVEYRLITGGEDLEDIYRLRYASFLKAGMLSVNASRMLSDRWDDLPNSYRFGVYYDGELMSTMRLHYLSAAHPYAPALDTFPEALEHRLKRGETFIDGTRFAADADKTPAPRAVPFLTIRLALVACCYFRQTGCLSAIKPEHTAFYVRTFGAREVAGPTPYPGLVVPRYLYETPCGDNLVATLNRFPFLRSTPIEQRMLFGSLPADRDPLIVLPTAKYARKAA